MAVPAVAASDISMPEFQRASSCQVSALLNKPDCEDHEDPLPPPPELPAPPPEMLVPCGEHEEENSEQMQYIVDPPPLESAQEEDSDMQDKQIIIQKDEAYKLMQQKQEEDEALRKIQSKYASPENIIPPPKTPNTNDIEDVNDDIADNLKTNIIVSDNKNSILPSTIGHLIKENSGNGSVSAFSDTSSDVSDATTSAPSVTNSNSPAPMTLLVPSSIAEGVTDEDIQKVDIFYRSQKTDVRVCNSLVNMYLSVAKTLDRMPAGNQELTNADGSPQNRPDATKMSMEDWDFIKTGIPVLVLNTRTEKLSIILAEKGTGFVLWEDVLTTATLYETPHMNFHTMSLSTDHSRLVGFSFDEATAATEFAQAVRALQPKPEEEVTDKKKKKKREKEKEKMKKQNRLKYKPPRKIDISGPCCFIHVTKLDRGHLSMFPTPPSGIELTRQGMLRSQSLSSDISECSTATAPSEH